MRPYQSNRKQTSQRNGFAQQVFSLIRKIFLQLLQELVPLKYWTSCTRYNYTIQDLQVVAKVKYNNEETWVLAAVKCIT